MNCRNEKFKCATYMCILKFNDGCKNYTRLHLIIYFTINITAELGILLCEDPDESVPPKITKLEAGDQYIFIKPLLQTYTYVNLYPLDYEVMIVIIN